jgi:rubrerythrin
VQTFICSICGDPYSAAEKPGNCPFCGALETFIVLAEDFKEEEVCELSDITKSNLEYALLMENNSMLFYACSHAISMNSDLVAMFKELEGMEAKHASIIRKMLSVAEPEEVEDNRGRCHALDQLNLTDSIERENRAIDLYRKIVDEAVEARVKKVFTALIEIETAHTELIKDMGSKFGVQFNPVV